ncbi:NTF2 fold immunity protein [Photorhabdus akhurstii]|uniref:NTF2 fold immunity protein n=1 Tax=Photorhabdus akhurstii TaxID=171438 RepID=UPI001BD2EF0F|nr:NTF2 fold immunity protein [Photorhabdus akhurstii]MBS9429662.1 hypothetical protein [Photorhabdus akhurstii]
MNNIERAQSVLETFIQEMNKWEVFYYREGSRKRNTPIVKEKMKNELDEIFSKNCTLKERKQGRQVSLMLSSPPDNDEITSKELDKNKAIFIIQKHTGFKNKYRYTLHFKNNEWRVDKKEWLSGDKWKQDYL